MPANPSLIAASLSRRHARHAALFASVSVAAMLVVSPGAYAKPMGGWTPSPSAAAIAAAQSGQQEAARAARQAANSLKRATLAIQAQQASQQAARDAARAALSASSVTNGLGVGGLQRAPGAVPGSDFWQGANLPTQFTDGDRTKVNIEQTKQKAILTWDTFNVGGNTDLTFQQQASNWVALNRVTGGSSPSQILGSIKADGSVYIINQNGIIFGGASQVNVGALIASTAKISNEQFLNSGIYSTGSGLNWTPSFTEAGGLVKVEQGAEITTHAPPSVTAGGGFVLLMGTQVENAGTIATPKGQVTMAAGDDFVLRPGYGTDANALSSTRGNEIAPVIRSALSGTVANSGMIFSQQGDITLAGRTIAQNGILLSTTSVNTRGTIHLLNSATDTLGSVVFGANSLTDILPELDSDETALNSQRDALIKASGSNAAQAIGRFDNLSTLADRLDQSRIEIVTGGNAVFKGGSLTIAQGGQVAASAGKRIITEDGATIDASGVRDVGLAMSANNIMVNIQGNELRDSPVNRDKDYLKNANVWIDIRNLVLLPSGTGGYASDRYYTPGGLLEIGGYLSNTAHKIGEWTALGGTITLSAPQVTAQQGSIFDVSGGSVMYAGGNIITTNFLSADGHTYNVNSARGDTMFYGLGQGWIRKSERWGVTEVWTSPLGRGRESVRWEDGYTVGRDAGQLTLLATESDIQATILADVVNGSRQNNARPQGVTDGYRLTQNTVALPGRFSIADLDRFIPMNIIPTGSVAFGSTAQRSGSHANHWFDTDVLSSFGLGGISVSSAASIDVLSALTLAPGGALSFSGGAVTISDDLTARSGSVNITANNTVTLRHGVMIDTRGLWTNALLDPGADLSRLAFINGGAINLAAQGALVLNTDSRLDASAGGAVLANTKTTGGNGGDVTLAAAGYLTLDGTVASYGFAKGGKLSISAGQSVAVGGMPLRVNGQLDSDEAAPVMLALAQPLDLPAGSKAPLSVTVTLTRIPNGQAIPPGANLDGNNPGATVGPAGWTIPPGSSAYELNGRYLPSGTVVAAGTALRMIINLPRGYFIPPGSFVDGLRIAPFQLRLVAGDILPAITTLPAGTAIPAGIVLGLHAAVQPVLSLDTSLFSQGFSSYALKSPLGFAVLPDVQLAVTQPVFQFTAASFAAPTGSDPATVAPVALPPLFLENPAKGILNQRGGADLTIGNPTERSQVPRAGQGEVTLGLGASITVDPGRSVSIGATDQITIEGSIIAHGGAITIVNNAWQEVLGVYEFSGRSVWIGDNARLDVSGLAATAIDSRGYRYGMVSNGGSISLGALAQSPGNDVPGLKSGNAFVVIRPGAELDASGASAVLDPLSATGGTQSRTVASSGGLISLASQWGIVLDGTVRAASGGAGASGGALSVILETPGLPLSYPLTESTVPANVNVGRVITVAQNHSASGLTGTAVPGALDPALALGQAHLGVDQVTAGGFDSVSLWARGAIAFDGDVSLSMARSLTLQKGPLVNTTDGGRVTLNAPYVFLDGKTFQDDTEFTIRGLKMLFPNLIPAYPSGGTLSISGALVDIRHQVRTVYDETLVTSAGDLRFLAATSRAYVGDSTTGTLRSVLAASGNLTLAAAQVYPAAGAVAIVGAGVSEQLDFSSNRYLRYNGAGSVLVIARNGETPSLPYSVFGTISFLAETVEQGGVVRAPFGAITLGSGGDDYGSPRTAKVELLPGSITSVSARGLIMPYGGTADGVSYAVDGAAPFLANIVTGSGYNKDGSTRALGVTLAGGAIISDAGSLVDLSGGGMLTGAAFVTGRGGSVDTLLTALANSSPANNYSAASNKVYAIMPGVITAPVAGGYNTPWTGATPGIGQQITIPDGVPGLLAGTYTLLPANYALLPGAYRVELANATTSFLIGTVGLTNGSYLTQAYQGIVNTAIRDVLPTQVIVTPGATVRNYAQYNGQGYSSFILSQAQQFGTLRSLVEADAKFLSAVVKSTAQEAANSALIFNGEVDFSPGTGGNGGTFILSAPDSSAIDLVITGPGSTTANTNSVTTVSASAIAAITAPNLYIGARPRADALDNSVYLSNGRASNLTLESGVLLNGANIFLTATNTITLNGGAVVSTLGRGFSGVDSRSGLAFGDVPRTFATGAIVAVSNGDIRLNTPSGAGAAKVVMKAGSGLYSDGMIGFYADRGLSTEGEIGIGAQRLTLGVASLNIGTETSLNAVGSQLPVGLNLTQGFLDGLLRGGGMAGAPAVQSLTLGASQSINFFGTVDLNTIDPAIGKSRLGELVLNTPAIYGYGASADQVRITTDTLVWSGAAVVDIAASQGQNQIFYKSAMPGARIAGLGDSGSFSVDARKVVFGYPAQSQPNSTLSLDRLMLGFGSVTFNATERVAANGKGTLSIYDAGPTVGATFDPKTYAGTGGMLVFNTPLMTAESGAVFGVYGNAVTVASSTGATAGAAGSLGGDLSITGDSLHIASAIVLPSGRISLAARGAGGDLVIADGAHLDVAGHPIELGNVRRQAWAGDVALTSLSGNVVLASGASVDVSSEGSDAGTLTVQAASGTARLDGTLRGQGAGNGARDGAFTLNVGNLGGASLTAEFASLNNRLSDAGFFYSRAFAFSSGDLVVGDDVRARNVSISVNGGSLTIAGRIDATGAKTGSIRLAARDDLTLAASAMLDVRGTTLVRDSYGQVIDASNRNSVELTSSQGWVRLNEGTTIDTSSPDAIARGHVDINARRIDETGGDIAIDASEPLNLRGIASLAVNGFWTYSPTDAAGTIVQDTDAVNTPVGAVGLKQIDALNQIFYANALTNTGLQRRLAGLQSLGGAYHLRPGVEIVSSAASGGKLTVQGDLDLSGYRYGPNADRNTASATYGFGEAMAFTVRAADDLALKGSINDGFAPPKTSPDENGFRDRPKEIVTQITPAFQVDPENGYQAPGNVTLAEDWVVPSDDSLASGYAVTSDYGQYFYPGDVVPTGTTLAGGYYFTLYSGTVPATKAEVTRSQGKIWAIAPMLAPGAMSSSIRLVSGADLASADRRGLRASAALAGTGNMTLDDFHTTSINGRPSTSEIFSVIRTGTGDLDLLSGGGFKQKSLYGIYTAGTQVSDDAGFHLSPSAVAPSAYTATANAVASYFPDHGGDLLVKVQGSLSGYRPFNNSKLTTDQDQWLYLQGNDALGQPTAWSINFGSYKADSVPGGVAVAGVTGFGAYGGGNVAINVGGDAGGIAAQLVYSQPLTGLTAAVGSTGRVINGQLVQTGGGDLDVRIGGGLNPLSAGGRLIDLRGTVSIAARSIGAANTDYRIALPGDPRGFDPYAGSMLSSTIAGPSLSLGDASITLRALGSVTLADVVDPGIRVSRSDGSGDWIGATADTSVATWFSLWRPGTSLDLLSLGGNVTLGAASSELPPVFRAAAASGNLYLMNVIGPRNLGNQVLSQVAAADAALELLAGGAIYASKSSISMSAADASQMPDPFHPAWVVYQGTYVKSFNTLSTYDASSNRYSPIISRYAFVPNRPLTNLHANDPDPVLVRAVTGDIVGLSLTTAKRLDMSAAGDIVGTISNGRLDNSIAVLNANAGDVSTITAGGALFYPGLTVGGPGTLSVTAGGDIYLGDKGSVVSSGPAFAGDNRLGASIVLTAGTGASGPDYAGLLKYLDPSHLAVPGTPLADQPGKVAKTYQDELLVWLQQRYGYAAADGAAARVYFAALAPEQQQIFLRQVYYAELTAGGREYNDAASSRYGSYLRGRDAIAALFPSDRSYAGDITMFGGSGIRTLFGGDIQMLSPGGRTVIGVEGVVPPSTAGVVTQGQGDIQMYAKGSILLGLSRIMTTFGGNILAWSAEGDINAGRGSKTTTIYTPPRRIYDSYGNVTLAPVVPSSGAGIATLNPIPQVKAGNIDLIAPLGTIDAGEAGIRVSGNVNLAALHIVNAANIQAQGTTTGIPTVQAPNIAGLTEASNTAGAAAQQAVTPGQGSGTAQPSIIIVEVLGFGGGGGEEKPNQEERRRGQQQGSYDPAAPIRVVGYGSLTAANMQGLTDEEKQKLSSRR